jgi:hypothetical protein
LLDPLQRVVVLEQLPHLDGLIGLRIKNNSQQSSMDDTQASLPVVWHLPENWPDWHQQEHVPHDYA